MEPIARHDHDSSAQRLGTEFVGAAGWPAQPKLVPVEITCKCSMSLSCVLQETHTRHALATVLLVSPLAEGSRCAKKGSTNQATAANQAT